MDTFDEIITRRKEHRRGIRDAQGPLTLFESKHGQYLVLPYTLDDIENDISKYSEEIRSEHPAMSLEEVEDMAETRMLGRCDVRYLGVTEGDESAFAAGSGEEPEKELAELEEAEVRADEALRVLGVLLEENGLDADFGFQELYLLDTASMLEVLAAQFKYEAAQLDYATQEQEAREAATEAKEASASAD